MKKYGVLNKETNKTEYVYDNHRQKNLGRPWNDPKYVQYEIASDTEYRAYSWDGTQITFDSEYVAFDSTQNYCKIYRYIEDLGRYNKNHPPLGHDYITGLTTRLFPKRTFVQGELQRVEWYADEALSDLILDVDITYLRNTLGFAEERTTTRTWYRENGQAATPAKITKKLYGQDMLGQIKEGIKRRGNIVEGLQMPVLGSMLATVPALAGETEPERQGRILLLGRRFLAQHKSGFTNFTEDSNKEIIEDITESADFWLDNVIDQNGTTIRQMIIAELSIDEPV